MKYLDGFRNPEAAAVLRTQILEVAAKLRAGIRVMEVCGSHTMAIGRYGIRSLLPKNLELISGPGCPVCVTEAGYIDAAIELAQRGVVIATFGDMLNVPGSHATLASARSEGARIEVCYSPTAALDLAGKDPETEVVFLAIGFETTIPPVISLVDKAIQHQVSNLSLLTAFKRVPPALAVLASDPELKIDAFLCPAHVSAIIGAEAYHPFAREYKRPCVIAGFEPLDILLGLKGILEQLRDGRAEVDNQYNRVVREEGNILAKQLMEKYLEPVDAAWRGLGTVPKSGLGLKPRLSRYDAATRHGVEIPSTPEPAGCRCGEVIKGKIKPPDCLLFGKACVPDRPVGPCMVSAEGTCAAYFKYRDIG